MLHKAKETPLPDGCSEKLADDFKDFFIDRISNIHGKFKQDGNFDEYDNVFTGSSLSEFSLLSPDEVIKMVNESSTKSCELDPIPTPLLKSCLPELAPVLQKIINLSLENGAVPEQFKHAVIRPLLKKQEVIQFLKTIDQLVICHTSLSWLRKL